MTAIRHGPGSYIWAIAATSSLGTLAVFGGSFWFPIMTIWMFGISGMTLSLLAERFLPEDEIAEQQTEPAEQTPSTAPLIAVGVVFALVVFSVLSWIVRSIRFTPGAVTYVAFFSPVTLPLTTSAEVLSSLAFLVVMVPWGEEEFFRGMWGNAALHLIPKVRDDEDMLTVMLATGGALLTAGIVFMVAHSPVYSLFAPLNPGLIAFLIGSGAVLVAVGIATGEIFATELAHGVNNGISFLTQGSVVAYFFPGAVLPPWAPVVAAVIPSVLVARAFIMKSRRARPVKAGLPI